jgi:diguanylate cyclase (GGDEF)-like protein
MQPPEPDGAEQAMPDARSDGQGGVDADGERKDAFLAVLAHELRNRLAPVRLAWEVVRHGGQDADRFKQATRILDHQLAALVPLVDDVLDVSRIERGRLSLYRERTDLRHILSQQAQAAGEAAAARGIRFLAALPEEAVLADVDAGRIGQSFARLLAHAVHCTPPGGTVGLSARTDGPALLIEVRYDPGSGLAPERLTRLFSLLCDRPGQQPGELGIELHLAGRLIQMHGGSIRAMPSADGLATELSVHLPLAHGQTRPAITVGAAPRPALHFAQDPDRNLPAPPQPAAAARGPRILLVDDNRDLREHVGALLRMHWEVEEHADGEAALHAARARPPDLVLTDVMMPVLDGFGLVRALRAEPRTREVPVIMISGRSAEEARVEGLDAGADDYLVKPFGVRELLARVRTHLDVARLRREAVEAAKHDPLTGLANREQGYAFADAIFARARRSATLAAVLVIDLDRFKPINDTYGHEVGDRVLQEVARRLKASLRGEDIVARLGGDEFLVVLSSVRSAADAEDACRHLLGSFAQAVAVRELRLRISPSIGISIFPDDGTDIVSLAKNADMAMYHAKKGHRAGYHFFTPELNRRASRVQSIEARLRHSLDQREFELHYQPIVDLSRHTLEGVEALMRWPGTGIGPEEFIPIAEISGTIEQLGEWAMRECCRAARVWQQEGLPDVTVSINVSPLQFRHPGLLPAIAGAVEENQVDPSRVQLELTESALLHDAAEAISHMQAIKQYGLKLALDDFGRGYSSLHYIGRLPLDTLKVDQSFVRSIDVDLASAAVTDAVIAIGRSLGLRVVAEGIESEEVLKRLLERDCHRLQGNLICPPLRAGELMQWYRRWSTRRPEPLRPSS